MLIRVYVSRLIRGGEIVFTRGNYVLHNGRQRRRRVRVPPPPSRRADEIIISVTSPQPKQMQDRVEAMLHA